MASTALSTAKTIGRAITPMSQSSQTRSQPAQAQQSPQTPRSIPQLPSQPGTWRHPKMDEIARRQNAGVLNGDSVNRAVLNSLLLVSTFFVPGVVYSYLPQFVQAILTPLEKYQAYPYLLVRLYFLAMILLSVKPLFANKDDINDIPLTPSQRALLGLKPNNNAPLTPGDGYITPPRYSRSVTPRSSASSRANSRSPFSESPLTGRSRSGSMDRSMAASARAGSGSPYSGSPLVQKALSGSTTRRLSFDSGSGSGNSGFPSTPTPVTGTGRASVGLNNKWLYERGRGSPGGRGLFA